MDDVWFEVFDYLNFEDLCCLRRTCSYFYELIPVPHIRRTMINDDKRIKRDFRQTVLDHCRIPDEKLSYISSFNNRRVMAYIGVFSDERSDANPFKENSVLTFAQERDSIFEKKCISSNMCHTSYLIKDNVSDLFYIINNHLNFHKIFEASIRNRPNRPKGGSSPKGEEGGESPKGEEGGSSPKDENKSRTVTVLFDLKFADFFGGDEETIMFETISLKCPRISARRAIRDFKRRSI